MTETLEAGQSLYSRDPAATTTTDHIDIALIDPDPHNIRRTQPGTVEDALFVRSMESLGLIEPILLRATAGGRFTLIAGGRRLAGAKKLTWGMIPAIVHHGIDDIAARALQAAENAHRAPMHPLDVWRAMVSLQEGGMRLELAGQCLGITDKRARQLDRLGRIAAPLIDAMYIDGIPDDDELARIAQAEPADQLRVFKQHVKGKVGPNTHIHWWSIARDLTSTVIPMGHAIFDTDKVKGIAWQEDVFAEPGSKAVFTTTHRKAFMKAQAAALAEKVGKRAKKGELVEIVETDAGGSLVIPAGFKRMYDPPPKSMKLLEGDPRRLLIGIGPDGRVQETLVIAEGRRAPKSKPPKVAKTARAADNGDDAAEAGEAPDAPIVEAEKRSMTAEGLKLLAAAKTQAIRQCLTDDRQAHSVSMLLQLVCVAMCGRNVTILNRGNYGRDDMEDVLFRLVTPAGRLNVDLSIAELGDIAADVIARATVVGGPAMIGSGHAARIIGDAIAAIDHMEPLDSPEFLKTLPLPLLKAAAAACDITGAKTGTALRDRLQGKIGTRWRPDEAEFRPEPLEPPMDRSAERAIEGDDEDEDGEIEEAA
jgi:hypothetical protein